MSVKEEVLRMIGRLPDDATIDDVVYHLHVFRKVQQGLSDIEAGRVVSQAEAERLVAEWINAHAGRSGPG